MKKSFEQMKVVCKNEIVADDSNMMNKGLYIKRKDADRAKLHQSRSFHPNLSEPALVGGSLLTLEKAQNKKREKEKKGEKRKKK